MRRATPFFSAALIALGLSGCAKAQEAAPSSGQQPTAAAPPPRQGIQQATATSLQPLTTRKFGAEITEKNNTSLDALMRDPSRFTSKIVRTEGVVSAVCQSMGCWMEVSDEAGNAHIKMAGPAFFVPKEANGHRAVIQGKVLGADKDHFAAEAEAMTGKAAKVQIEATGVEFVN